MIESLKNNEIRYRGRIFYKAKGERARCSLELSTQRKLMETSGVWNQVGDNPNHHVRQNR